MLVIVKVTVSTVVDIDSYDKSEATKIVSQDAFYPLIDELTKCDKSDLAVETTLVTLEDDLPVGWDGSCVPWRLGDGKNGNSGDDRTCRDILRGCEKIN